jgi:hypothetical protein
MWRLVVLGSITTLVIYYARYFLLIRQEVPTIVQICLLLAAAAITAIPARAAWTASHLQAWMTALVATGLSMAFFVWADRDPHSASDTLNRAVPAIALVVAVALWIATWRRRPDGMTVR